MRFDNFTHATCILYIDLVETLNFQLRYLVEKVARIINGRTVNVNPLVTALFLSCLHMLLLSELCNL